MDVALDIETENTGGDPMADSKRIISVQIADDKTRELYWDDSNDPSHSLSCVGPRISELVSGGAKIAGYYITGFDVPLLKTFLGITIPDSNVIELMTTKKVLDLHRTLGTDYPTLEQVCNALDIDVTHKRLMSEKARELMKSPQLIAKARQIAEELAKSKGRDAEYWFRKKLPKVAEGNAIFDSYQEFVETSGEESTLFHRYAMGDAVCEYQLLMAVSDDVP